MMDKADIRRRTPRAASALSLTFGVMCLLGLLIWLAVDQPYERLNPVDRAIRDTTSTESLFPVLFHSKTNRGTAAVFFVSHGYRASGDLAAQCKQSGGDVCSWVRAGYEEMYVRDGICLLYVVYLKYADDQLLDARGHALNRCAF